MLNRTSLYDGQLEFADANIAGLTSMSAGKDSYRVFRMKNSQFKNWHGRQFLNRILGRNIRGFEQQAEWIEYLNMLVSIKILARILMLHIGCTFGEWYEKLFTRQNQKNYINCVRTGF